VYLFYCDESNLEPRPGDFFVYGGLVIPGESALALSQEVDKIRRDAGIPEDFRLKFNPGPEELGHKEFIAVKQGILEAAAKAGCVLITSFISHDIASDANVTFPPKTRPFSN
jgi:hypothetical protein